MNKGFYDNLDTNFEEALKMVERSFSHVECIELLKNGNIPQKQLAALRLDSINNLEEAKVLLFNLTGCDGKIREAVALKINQLLVKSPELINYFATNPDVFAKASIDINANICRLVIDSVGILKVNKCFSEQYLALILQYIQSTFEELDKFIFRDKKYIINKQLFKLYWCLEALRFFASDVQDEEIYKILERCSQEREYTIREQTAKILAVLKSPCFDKIKIGLKSDENYYVRLGVSLS